MSKPGFDFLHNETPMFRLTAINLDDDIELLDNEVPSFTFPEVPNEDLRVPPYIEEPSIWEKLTKEDTKRAQMLSWETIGKFNLQQNIVSPYLSESNISTCEAVYHEHFHHQFSYGSLDVTVSREVLVQDILHLVIGTSSNSFIYDPLHMRFIPKVQNIRIRGCSAKSMNMMLCRFLNIGSHIRRLEIVSERCMKAIRLYGLTGIAFGRSLSSFVKFIQKSIVSMAEKSSEQKNMEIVHLYHAMDDVSLIIERIAVFCRCDVANSRISELSLDQKAQLDDEGFYLPFGSKILSEIYITAETIDSARSPFLRAVFLAFLEQSSEPFFEMLSSWFGILSSSCSSLPINTRGEEFIYSKEFFMSNFKVDAISVKDNGDEFWQGGIEVDNLPTFISSVLARDVIEAGKALRLLRDCRPDHPLCNSSTFLNQITDKSVWDLNMKFLFIQRDIDEMHDQLNNYLRDMIIAIVTKDEQRRSEITHTHDIYQCKLTQPKQKSDLWSTENINHFTATDHSTEDPTIMLIERFLQIQSSTSPYAHKEYILPLGVVTDLVIRHTLISHCRLIDASILSIFFHDLGLRAHLSVLREFMLMGNGTFISGLTDALFSDNVDHGEHFTANGNYGSKFGTGLRLNSRQIWPPTGIEWTIALKAVVMETILLEKRNIENDNSRATIDAWGKVNDLDNRLMFGVNPDINNCCDPNALDVLDSLYLEYKPPYPINVIITPSSLEIYNRLFVFLLRILRMGIVINHVHRILRDRHLFDDDDTAKDKKLVQIFRFEAQQFIVALRGYIFDVAISSTWTYFMKRLDGIAKEAKFELPRDHAWRRNSTSDTTSHLDSQSDALSTTNTDDFEDDEDNEDFFEGVKGLESLRTYHNHILDRMLFQCLLKKKQESNMKILNEIQIIILDFARLLQLRRFRRYDTSMKQEFWEKIKILYEKFRLSTVIFKDSTRSLGLLPKPFF